MNYGGQKDTRPVRAWTVIAAILTFLLVIGILFTQHDGYWF